jgi:hypothetical protein
MCLSLWKYLVADEKPEHELQVASKNRTCGSTEQTETKRRNGAARYFICLCANVKTYAILNRGQPISPKMVNLSVPSISFVATLVVCIPVERIVYGTKNGPPPHLQQSFQ